MALVKQSYENISQHIIASVECNVLFCALSSLFVCYYISRWSYFHKTLQSCQSLDNILVYNIIIAGRYAIIFLRPDDCDYKPKNMVTIIFIYFRVTLLALLQIVRWKTLVKNLFYLLKYIFIHCKRDSTRNTCQEKQFNLGNKQSK